MYCGKCNTKLIENAKFCGVCGMSVASSFATENPFVRNYFTEFDFDTIEGIKAIPMPLHKQLKTIETPINNIEYVLQRKATEHKKNGCLDLAIACLKKSNEIMLHSNFYWAEKDYLRVVEYLKIAGKFDEARAEETYLKSILPKLFEHINEKNGNGFKALIKKMREWDEDLVLMSEHGCVCGECAKYQGRVYSLSGKDKRFPKLPDFIWQNEGKIHFGCIHALWSYFPDMSRSLAKDIKKSNRPYIDNRTNEEKTLYNEHLQQRNQEIIDRSEYDLIREYLPESAPKSFGSFRRMKNEKTKNYMILIDKSIKIDFQIDKIAEMTNL